MVVSTVASLKGLPGAAGGERLVVGDEAAAAARAPLAVHACQSPDGAYLVCDDVSATTSALFKLYNATGDAVLTPGNSLELVGAAVAGGDAAALAALLTHAFSAHPDVEHIVFAAAATISGPVKAALETVAASYLGPAKSLYVCYKTSFFPAPRVRRGRLQDYDDLLPLMETCLQDGTAVGCTHLVTAAAGGDSSDETQSAPLAAALDPSAAAATPLIVAEDGNGRPAAMMRLASTLPVPLGLLESAVDLSPFRGLTKPSASATVAQVAQALADGRLHRDWFSLLHHHLGDLQSLFDAAAARTAAALAALPESVPAGDLVRVQDIATCFDAAGDAWGYRGTGGERLGHALLRALDIPVTPTAVLTRDSLNGLVSGFAFARDCRARRGRVAGWYCGPPAAAQEGWSWGHKLVTEALTAAAVVPAPAAPAAKTAAPPGEAVSASTSLQAGSSASLGGLATDGPRVVVSDIAAATTEALRRHGLSYEPAGTHFSGTGAVAKLVWTAPVAPSSKKAAANAAHAAKGGDIGPSDSFHDASHMGPPGAGGARTEPGLDLLDELQPFLVARYAAAVAQAREAEGGGAGEASASAVPAPALPDQLPLSEVLAALEEWEAQSLRANGTPKLVLTAPGAGPSDEAAFFTVVDPALVDHTAEPPAPTPGALLVEQAAAALSALLGIKVLRVPALLAAAMVTYDKQVLARKRAVAALEAEEEKKRKEAEEEVKKAKAKAAAAKAAGSTGASNTLPKKPGSGKPGSAAPTAAAAAAAAGPTIVVPEVTAADPRTEPLKALAQALAADASLQTTGFVLVGVPAASLEVVTQLVGVMKEAGVPPSLHLHLLDDASLAPPTAAEAAAPFVPFAFPGTYGPTAYVDVSTASCNAAAVQLLQLQSGSKAAMPSYVAPPALTDALRQEALLDALLTERVVDAPALPQMLPATAPPPLSVDGLGEPEPEPAGPAPLVALPGGLVHLCTLAALGIDAAVTVAPKRGDADSSLGPYIASDAFVLDSLAVAPSHYAWAADMLVAAFDAFPSRSYCVALLPHEAPLPPVLVAQKFVRCRMPPTASAACPVAVYVCHRDALVAPALLEVRPAAAADRLPLYDAIRTGPDGADVMSFFTTSIALQAAGTAAGLAASVAVLDGELVGVACLSSLGCEPPALEALCNAFQVEAALGTDPLLSRSGSKAATAPSPLGATLVHFWLHPRLHCQAGYFLRRAMRGFGARGVSTLWVRAGADGLLPSGLLPTCVPLLPRAALPPVTTAGAVTALARRVAAAASATAAAVAARPTAVVTGPLPTFEMVRAASCLPGVADAAALADAAQLAHPVLALTPRLAARPVRHINARVMLVGASDTAVSTALALAARHDLYLPGLTLVAPGGMAPGSSVLAAMAPGAEGLLPPFAAAREYSAREVSASPLSLKAGWGEPFLHVVDGAVTRISREDRQLVLGTGMRLAYDHCVMASGLSEVTWARLGYGTPGDAPQGMHCIGPSAGGSLERGGALEAEVRLLARLHARRDPYAASLPLVVYGDAVDALCTIEALLARGVPATHIVFVQPRHDVHDVGVMQGLPAAAAAPLARQAAIHPLASLSPQGLPWRPAAGLAPGAPGKAAARSTVSLSGAPPSSRLTEHSSVTGGAAAAPAVAPAPAPAPAVALGELGEAGDSGFAAAGHAVWTVLTKQLGIKCVRGPALTRVSAGYTADLLGPVSLHGGDGEDPETLTSALLLEFEGASSPRPGSVASGSVEAGPQSAGGALPSVRSLPGAIVDDFDSSLVAALLICADTRDVDPRMFRAVNDSGLVYDGRLVVDHALRTSDPRILAGGPLARWSRRTLATAPATASTSLEVLCAREVGTSLCGVLLADLGAAAAPATTPFTQLTATTASHLPKRLQALLPGGLALVASGLGIPPATLSAGGKPQSAPLVLTTAGASDAGAAHTVLTATPSGVVTSITCCGPRPAFGVDAAALLAALPGLPASYLGAGPLQDAVASGSIKDLCSFMQQQWMAALSHTAFKAFVAAARSTALAQGGPTVLAAFNGVLTAVDAAVAKGTPLPDAFKTAVAALPSPQATLGDDLVGAIKAQLLAWLASARLQAPPQSCLWYPYAAPK